MIEVSKVWSAYNVSTEYQISIPCCFSIEIQLGFKNLNYTGAAPQNNCRPRAGPNCIELQISKVHKGGGGPLDI